MKSRYGQWRHDAAFAEHLKVQAQVVSDLLARFETATEPAVQEMVAILRRFVELAQEYVHPPFLWGVDNPERPAWMPRGAPVWEHRDGACAQYTVAQPDGKVVFIFPPR